MFKNPLKYATGGQMEAAEEQLISAVAQSLGAQPEQVKARLEEIKSNPQETQELQQALQLMQEDKNAGFKSLLNLFTKSSRSQSAIFKEGGKLQSFICKHAKGGSVDCGCKQEGGWLPNPEFKSTGEILSRDSNNPNLFSIQVEGFRWNDRDLAVPTREGAFRFGKNAEAGAAYDNSGERVYSSDTFNNIRNFFEEKLPNAGIARSNRERGLINREANGDTIPVAKDAKQGRSMASRNTVRVGDSGIAKRRRVGAAIDKSGGQHVYEGSTIRGNWAETWASVPHPGDTIVIQTIPTASGNDTSTRTYPMGSNEYNSVMKRFRPLFNGFFPQYQEGGELTRKEALRLGRENKGYNRGQSRFAYQNAKNTLRNHSNLRGKELRQIAREWVAGQNKAPYYLTPAQKDRYNEFYYDTGTVMSQPLSQGPNIPEPSVVSIGLVGERPSDTMANLDNMSFNNAFRTALNNGKTLFIWKGKPYTTELAQKPSWTNIDINSLPQDVINNLIGNVEVEIPSEPVQLPDEILTFSIPDMDAGVGLPRRPAGVWVNPNHGFRSSYYKKGGIVKAQEGATIEPYYNSNPINEWIKNKFNNNSTLYHLQQGLQNFKESAPGKMLSFFIPNPNSENGMIGAVAPIGKITSGSQFVSRIPKQKPSIKIMEDLGNGKFSAIDDAGKAMIYDYNLDKNLYDINKTFNTDNFINNIDLSNLIEKNTFSKRFIKYLKNDVLPHTETDWLKYGLGSIGGATAEAALIKYMQNKENKQSSKNKK